MALTINIVKRNKLMNEYSIVADITFDNSYTTGGKALLPSDFGLATLDAVDSIGAKGYGFEYDYVNQKLKAFTGANTEVTAATDLSTLKVRVLGVGY